MSKIQDLTPTSTLNDDDVVPLGRGSTSSRKITGANLKQAMAGQPGYAGWTPVPALEQDGARIVLKVVEWVGGEGGKPATGVYVGATGLVSSIANAVDVAGALNAAAIAAAVGNGVLASKVNVTNPTLNGNTIFGGTNPQTIWQKWGDSTKVMVPAYNGTSYNIYSSVNGDTIFAAFESGIVEGQVGFRTWQRTVAQLPSAATAGLGTRSFVTDANATHAAGLGNTVAGGGANKVPVYSDGTNWKIG